MPLQWHFGGSAYEVCKAIRIQYSYQKYFEGLQLDANGDIIPALTLQPANYTVLGKMSALSNAKSYRAVNRRQLQNIYDEIDRLEKTEVKLRRFTTYRPLFQWPLLVAFGLLALELVLTNTRYRRVP